MFIISALITLAYVFTMGEGSAEVIVWSESITLGEGRDWKQWSVVDGNQPTTSALRRCPHHPRCASGASPGDGQEKQTHVFAMGEGSTEVIVWSESITLGEGSD